MVMKPLDTISLKEGNVVVTVGSATFDIAEIKECEATVNFSTVEVQAMGARMPGEKVVGMKGEGKMKIYGQNPILRKRAEEYLKTGRILDVSVKGTMDDATSSAGRQTVLLKGIVVKSAKLFQLSTEDGVFEDETDFTFNDFEILEHFKK